MSAGSLVIIESPAKARTLRGYLGGDFEIVASMGHVRDLPRQRLGVSTDSGFKPQYTILPEKRSTIEDLRRIAKKYDTIYLAADPDREGEAICWHLSELLKRDGVKFKRLKFNEITKDAVLGSLKKAGEIDMDLVDAQQARRVMDRLVGYRISPYLWRAISSGLSAGRVQSVALRLVQEREDQIASFVPVEYWPVKARFGQGGEEVSTTLVRIAGKRADGDRHAPGSKEEVDLLLPGIRAESWTLSSIERREATLRPLPPFITSTLQQGASSTLGLSPSRTMSLAQELYEGMDIGGEHSGLITYMRTDSVRIAPEAQQAAREFLEAAFGPGMLPPTPRRFRSSSGSQDAHEAIRPTDPARTPEMLKGRIPDQHLRLYGLIWRRFTASQASDAIVDRTAVTFTGGVYEFRATGEALRSRGFLTIDPGQASIESPMPGSLAEGRAGLLDVTAEQCFTKPPSRFTEAGLVAEMKKLGIGRPSTYVSIIDTIRKRSYVVLSEKRLRPTELGTATVRLLVDLFPAIFETSFTASMEEMLDSVASGGTSYEEAVSRLQEPLELSLKSAVENLGRVRSGLSRQTGEKCPQCGSPLLLKPGRFGSYLSCSDYPSCRFRKSAETAVDSGRKCPDCGSPLVFRTGRFGRYLGCSGAACRHTEPAPTGVACPEEGCSGELVERRSKKGRIFYSCSRFPECRHASWRKPVARRCERCGFPYLEETAKGLMCPSCRKPAGNS